MITAGGWRKVARALGAGDDHRDAAVALLAAVEQAQHGFDDPPRVLMVLERDRPFVEPRVGIACRVGAVDDGDPAEILVGDAVGRHVPLGVQRDPRRGRQQAERRVVRHEQRCLTRRPRARAAEPEPGAFVECAVAHHGVGRARRHRHRGLHDRARRGPAAVVHPAEERQVADADVSRDLDLVARVHREGDHAVDIAGPQSGVVDRGFDCLAGELELAAPGLLGELGLADACDGRLPAERLMRPCPRAG